MAKKRVLEKKKTLKQIDNIPNCSHQRRSSPPKRRTDFSSFFCNSFSTPDSGSFLGSSCGILLPSNTTSNGVHEMNAEGKEIFQSSLVQCSKSQEEGSRFSNSTEASILEVELVDQNALLESCDDREVGKDSSDVLEILDYTPMESHVAERKALVVSPVSVAWVKTHKMWLSAEDFQHKERQILSSELVKRTAASDHSDEQDLLSDKSTLSVSSQTEDDILETGRGKRERKPKLHFDDITFPLKSEKKPRRIRIMRYLGLTPPVGSPF